MKTIQDLVNEIEPMFTEFMTEATSNLNGNKAAGRRARKVTLTLTKLFKEYRTTSILSERPTQDE
jgi:hypothetical protein